MQKQGDFDNFKVGVPAQRLHRTTQRLFTMTFVKEWVL